MSKLSFWKQTLGCFLLLSSVSVQAKTDEAVVLPDLAFKSSLSGLSPNGQEGFVSIKSGIKLYVWHKPGVGRPIVLLNGLSQDLDSWVSVVPELLKTGRPIIAYDDALQGRSLMKYLKERWQPSDLFTHPLIRSYEYYERMYWGDREPIVPFYSSEMRAQQLYELISALGYHGKADLVGLSLGGSLMLQFGSMYPSSVGKLIGIAPGVGRTPVQEETYQFAFRYANMLKTLWPMNPYDYEGLALELSSRLFLYSVAMQEPTVLKWGAFQVLGASQLFDSAYYMDGVSLASRLPAGSLHIAWAEHDQYMPRTVLDNFWERIPARVKGSLMIVKGTEHKLNESVGPFIGSYVAAVGESNKIFNPGETLEAEPQAGLVNSSDAVLKLEPAKICENLLMRQLAGEGVELPFDRIRRKWITPYTGYAGEFNRLGRSLLDYLKGW